MSLIIWGNLFINCLDIYYNIFKLNGLYNNINLSKPFLERKDRVIITNLVSRLDKENKEVVVEGTAKAESFKYHLKPNKEPKIYFDLHNESENLSR